MARTSDFNLQLFGIALQPVKIEIKAVGAAITTSKIAYVQFWGGAAIDNKNTDIILVQII